MKYNGEPIKIMGLDKSVYEDIINFISSDEGGKHNAI